MTSKKYNLKYIIYKMWLMNFCFRFYLKHFKNPWAYKKILYFKYQKNINIRQKIFQIFKYI